MISVPKQDVPSKPWMIGASWHGGSSFGNIAHDIRVDVAETAYRVARDTAIRRGNYGGGQPQGFMSIGPVAFAAGGVENNIGVNLVIFEKIQGGSGAFGLKHAVARDIHERMMWMRHGTEMYHPPGLKHPMNGTEVELAAPGGNGTIQEIIEWIVSPNRILKPVAALNFSGYWEGMDRAFIALVTNELAPESLLSDRWRLINAPSDAVEFINDLNSRPSVNDNRENLNPVESYEEETETAVIIEPLSLKGIYHFANGMVEADLSPITGYPDNAIKPRILVYNGTGVAEGLKEQFNRGFEEGLIHPGRKKILHFADDWKKARAMARQLKTLTPEELGKKHGEKPKTDLVQEIVNEAVARADLVPA